MPAKAADLPRPVGVAGANGSVMCDTAAEDVADEGFDRVGFVESYNLASTESRSNAVLQFRT